MPAMARAAQHSTLPNPSCRFTRAQLKPTHLRGLAAARLAAQHDHVVAQHGLHHLLLHAGDGQPLPAEAAAMHVFKAGERRHARAGVRY